MSTCKGHAPLLAAINELGLELSNTLEVGRLSSRAWEVYVQCSTKEVSEFGVLVSWQVAIGLLQPLQQLKAEMHLWIKMC